MSRIFPLRLKGVAMKKKMEKSGAFGFTLIELLIVIGIISTLLQMILPAVQMSREAARQTQCKNNLRQIGMATLLHEGATGRFPTGGWSRYWVGDPDRGNDRRQPGGWIYNILPYIEQQALHDLGSGVTDEIAKREATAELMRTPLPIFNCPSRRLSRAYPFTHKSGRNFEWIEKSAKSDYAGNGGDHFPYAGPISGPETFEEADSEDYHEWALASGHTGIIFQISEVRNAQITDGTSQTYLAGEKFLDSRMYKTGLSVGDDSSMYIGYDLDNLRTSGNPSVVLLPPKHNSAHLQYNGKPEDNQGGGAIAAFLNSPAVSVAGFGSAHIAGCNFVFCDGSVRSVSYEVDEKIHRHFTNRQDGQVSKESR